MHDIQHHTVGWGGARLWCEDVSSSNTRPYWCLQGKGTEDVINRYQGCQLLFLDIPNIHAVRDSLSRLQTVCESSAQKKWLSHLESTQWLAYISAILKVFSILRERTVDRNNGHLRKFILCTTVCKVNGEFLVWFSRCTVHRVHSFTWTGCKVNGEFLVWFSRCALVCVNCCKRVRDKMFCTNLGVTIGSVSASGLPLDHFYCPLNADSLIEDKFS